MIKKIRFDAISQRGTYRPLPVFSTMMRETARVIRLMAGENNQPRMVDNSTIGCGITASACV